jgi:hypothetical protein
LKIAEKVERYLHGATGVDYQRGLLLFLSQGVNAFGNLHRCRQLVGVIGMAPLAHKGRIQLQGLMERMTQSLGAFVTQAHLWGGSARGGQVHARLHEDKELIFRREALP